MSCFARLILRSVSRLVILVVVAAVAAAVYCSVENPLNNDQPTSYAIWLKHRDSIYATVAVVRRYAHLREKDGGVECRQSMGHLGVAYGTPACVAMTARVTSGKQMVLTTRRHTFQCTLERIFRQSALLKSHFQVFLLHGIIHNSIL